MFDANPYHSLTHVLYTAASYRLSEVVKAGIEHCLFTAIEKMGGAVEPDDLAKSLTISPRSAEKILGGLLAVKLIRKQHNGKLVNTPVAKRFLVTSSDLYLGDGLISLQKIGYQTWSTLSEALKKGAPLALQRTDQPQAEFWANLTQAIKPLTKPAAQSVTRLLDSMQFKPRSVLDLGGGSGVFGQAFLQRFPDCQVLQVDWQHVNELAEKTAKELGLAGRFNTCSENFLEGHWQKEKHYDVVILSHILHQESKESIIDLLVKARKSMKDDGYVIINEFCLNQERTGPDYGLIFALSMFLQNRGGDSFTIQEYAEFLSAAGFNNEVIYSPLPPATILIGKTGKPKDKKITHVKVKSSQLFSSRTFKDQKWDQAESTALNAKMLNLVHQQLCFAYHRSSFWRERISESLITATKLTPRMFEDLPLIDKTLLRMTSPYRLLPSQGKPYHIMRGTGGTTGLPVGVFWTKSDWQAALSCVDRFTQPMKYLGDLIVWNGYHQAHVSGPIFDDIVRHLKGIPITRHFRATDEQALEEIERFGANALILTPQSGSGKGGSLEDLLAIDPNFLSRLKIKGLMLSSTNADADLIEECKQQGVEAIINFYGCTETMPIAISCESDPFSLHICQGHNFVEVINQNGQQVKGGERGFLVVSRVGSENSFGIGPNLGTQLFRFVTGDEVTLNEDPCLCGRKTPRISKIERVLNIADKLEGGCQKWE